MILQKHGYHIKSKIFSRLSVNQLLNGLANQITTSGLMKKMKNLEDYHKIASYNIGAADVDISGRNQTKFTPNL